MASDRTWSDSPAARPALPDTDTQREPAVSSGAVDIYRWGAERPAEQQGDREAADLQRESVPAPLSPPPPRADASDEQDTLADAEAAQQVAQHQPLREASAQDAVMPASADPADEDVGSPETADDSDAAELWANFAARPAAARPNAAAVDEPRSATAKADSAALPPEPSRTELLTPPPSIDAALQSPPEPAPVTADIPSSAAAAQEDAAAADDAQASSTATAADEAAPAGGAEASGVSVSDAEAASLDGNVAADGGPVSAAEADPADVEQVPDSAAVSEATISAKDAAVSVPAPAAEPAASPAETVAEVSEAAPPAEEAGSEQDTEAVSAATEAGEPDEAEDDGSSSAAAASEFALAEDAAVLDATAPVDDAAPVEGAAVASSAPAAEQAPAVEEADDFEPPTPAADETASAPEDARIRPADVTAEAIDRSEVAEVLSPEPATEQAAPAEEPAAGKPASAAEEAAPAEDEGALHAATATDEAEDAAEDAASPPTSAAAAEKDTALEEAEVSESAPEADGLAPVEEAQAPAYAATEAEDTGSVDDARQQPADVVTAFVPASTRLSPADPTDDLQQPAAQRDLPTAAAEPVQEAADTDPAASLPQLPVSESSIPDTAEESATLERQFERDAPEEAALDAGRSEARLIGRDDSPAAVQHSEEAPASQTPQRPATEQTGPAVAVPPESDADVPELAQANGTEPSDLAALRPPSGGNGPAVVFIDSPPEPLRLVAAGFCIPHPAKVPCLSLCQVSRHSRCMTIHSYWSADNMQQRPPEGSQHEPRDTSNTGCCPIPVCIFWPPACNAALGQHHPHPVVRAG